MRWPRRRLRLRLSMPAPSGPVGINRVGVWGITPLSLLLVLGAVVLLYTLIAFWPAPAPAGTTGTPTTSEINYFGYKFSLSTEAQLFVVVALAGALGGMLHALRSLYWYVGNRDLRRSWILMYPILPLVGAVLGTIFYVVVRGGLLTTQTSTQDVNAYGFAAVSAIVGLFSEQAVGKLKEVFAALFAPAEKGSDHVAAAQTGTPVVSSVEPQAGPIGTNVIVVGANLANVTAIEFGGVSAQPTQTSDTQLTVTVPKGAASGEIALVSGDGRVSTGIQYTVTA